MFEIVVGCFSIAGVLVAIASLARSSRAEKHVESLKVEIEEIRISLSATQAGGKASGGGNISAGGYIKAGGSISAMGAKGGNTKLKQNNSNK